MNKLLHVGLVLGSAAFLFACKPQTPLAEEAPPPPPTGIAGTYVSDGYAQRAEGYDWVGVTVTQLPDESIALSVRSRADRKKPTCLYDTHAFMAGDNVYTTVEDGKSIRIQLVGDTLTIATENPADEGALAFFCSGGATVAGRYVRIPEALDPAQVDQTTYSKILRLQEVSFHVTSKPVEGQQELTIYAFGPTLVGDQTQVMRFDGTVVDAEVEDMNRDGSPEVVVYTQSGPDMKGQVMGCSINAGKSMSQIYFPPVAENVQVNAGYNGHDEFTLVEGLLGHRFPLYENGQPTGKTRQVTYKLVDGENSRVFQVDKVNEY